MKSTISNEKITFVSDSFNVEPWELRFNDEAVNYFWRPESIEKLGAAICFPLLGTLPDNTYSLDGKEYTMETHGFAKDFDYAVAEKSETSISYEINDNEKTIVQFPYKFRLMVVYTVHDTTLRTEYRVKNLDTREMYFSVGGHPRYACPIGDGCRFEDCYVEFEKPESPGNIVKSYGPVSIVEKHFSKDGMRVDLDYDMFEKGCFCLHPVNSGYLMLKNKVDARMTRLNIKGISHLQFWTSVGSPFLALEPWYGSITSIPAKPIESRWKERPGTLQVNPGEENSYFFDMIISR